jgi:hypothetical protein
MILWFELSVQTFIFDRSVLPSNLITIGLSTTLAGLFAGSALPLIYEALAELMFPLPESLSASVLVQFLNITALILLFIAPNHSQLINLLVLIVIISCVGMLACARFTYQRRDEDERHRSEHGTDLSQTDDISYGTLS